MGVLERFRLDGKVAVVTGASMNVGKAISFAFAEAGATVYMVARGEELLEKVAAEAREATGADIRTIIADVGSPEGTTRIIETVHGHHPQAHVLVNNALSRAHQAQTFEVSDEGWEESFNVNLLGPFRLCRGFGQRMFDGTGGSVINMLSGGGFVPVAGYVQYGSAKAALWAMTQYLSSEYAEKVRFNGLVPGTIVPPERAAAYSTSTWQQFDGLVHMNRAGDPMEVAGAALYLASDASSYTTGALIKVNGGRPQ